MNKFVFNFFLTKERKHERECEIKRNITNKKQRENFFSLLF